MQDLSDGEIEVCRVRTDLRLTAASELDNAFHRCFRREGLKEIVERAGCDEFPFESAALKGGHQHEFGCIPFHELIDPLHNTQCIQSGKEYIHQYNSRAFCLDAVHQLKAIFRRRNHLKATFCQQAAHFVQKVLIFFRYKYFGFNQHSSSSSRFLFLLYRQTYFSIYFQNLQ